VSHCIEMLMVGYGDVDEKIIERKLFLMIWIFRWKAGCRCNLNFEKFKCEQLNMNCVWFTHKKNDVFLMWCWILILSMGL
jgi:hypothetical protein